MDWVTADHHFGHANIIKFCNRPFSDVNEMDAAMINRWNTLIKPEDTVYHLGDFTLGRDAEQYFRQLNGEIYVVPGGHDKRWIKNHPFNILHPIHTIQVSGTPVILCHYSMRVWDRAHYGACHLYAHSHGKLLPLGRSMDVGVDCHNFYPLELEEVIKILLKIEQHDNGGNRKMSVMYKECSCDKWQQGMTQIDAFIMLGFTHGYKYAGEPFVYCPWCGKQIRDIPPEEIVQVELPKPVEYKVTGT